MIKLSDFKMRVTPTQVLFWGGPPSQWYKSNFEGYLPVVVTKDDGRRSIRKGEQLYKFSSAEKYMMMSKASIFDDQGTLFLMERENDVKKIKALGREVKRFDQAVWDSTNIAAVTIGNYYKMVQNDGLWAFITEMGDREYVEGSPHDAVWGVKLAWDDPKIEDKANWKGENRLGTCLNNVWDMIIAHGREADPFQAYRELIRSRGA
jgi:conserved hypothetical protein, ribA/ribD-fused